MSFKIKNTEVKISFTFFALILLFISVNKFKMYLLTLVFGLLHELVHLYFICKLSVPPDKITLTLFGGNIVKNSNTSLKNIYDFIINISAPIFNILIGLMLYFIVNDKTDNIQIIILVNLLLGCFNLLPFYNFDGGNAIRSLLLLKHNEEFTEKLLTYTSIGVALFFAVLTIMAFIKYKSNYSLILMSLYFIFSIVFKK